MATTRATNLATILFFQVLRSHLMHRDGLQTNTSAKSLSERFLDAVKRSHRRIEQLEKKLQRLTDEDLESPVFVAPGEYVMQFSLGTPPQQFLTSIDTGSDLCWVQCVPCMRCFQQPSALFNPLASSSYSQARCTDTLCSVSAT